MSKQLSFWGRSDMQYPHLGPWLPSTSAGFFFPNAFVPKRYATPETARTATWIQAIPFFGAPGFSGAGPESWNGGCNAAGQRPHLTSQQNITPNHYLAMLYKYNTVTIEYLTSSSNHILSSTTSHDITQCLT